MMNLSKLKFVVPIVLIFCLLITLIFFYVKKDSIGKGKGALNLDDLPTLLSIQNFKNFYYQDKSSEVAFLSTHKSSNKKVQSIKIYNYSTTYQKFFLTKELFFDYKSRLIKSAGYSTEGSDTAFTYYFYNDSGKIYLDVNIGSNKYDTVYTLRNFDKQNNITEEIKYNIQRKELNDFTTWNLKLISDSVLKLEETIYQSDLTFKNVLPYYKKNMNITLISPSEVKVYTNRTVCQDTAYNSNYEDLYTLENHQLVSTKYNTEFENGEDGNWISAKGEGYYIKREFKFYDDGEPEIKNSFAFSKSILNILDSMMQTLPSSAWKNHKEKHSAIAMRNKLFKEGKYGTGIEKEEALSIEEFTPDLWYLASLDSGKIKGFEGQCYVVGYNTPLKDDDGYNLRCLAIYENVDGVHKLRKESFHAIEPFVDMDDDFSYDDFNEDNFYVNINDGEISVSYGYMRGEASYTYAYQNGDWFLVRYESNHRTCCEVEMYSYDYKTKMYSASFTSTSEDDSKDTSINVMQNRPLVYMDSINVMKYDYDETGLLIK